MGNVKEYVAGFLFDEAKNYVALIRKNRPDWQAGCLNGIGGKVEPGEWTLQTQIREFEEETGVHYENWELFASIGADRNPRDGSSSWRVYYFRGFSTKDLYRVTSKTDEYVDVYNVGLLYALPKVYHLDWLIPLSLTLKSKTVLNIIECAEN
jgi:ADP-ribose pyrophosphatase